MSNKNEHEYEQDKHGGPVLDVVVELASHPAQAEQPHDLQGTEQTTDALNTNDSNE